MAQAHDVPGTPFYVSHLVYPEGVKLPLFEREVETREVRGDYRVGKGNIFRVPFTCLGVIVGRWSTQRPDSEFDAVAEAVGLTVTEHDGSPVPTMRDSYEMVP